MKKNNIPSRPLRLASKKRILYALKAGFLVFSVVYFLGAAVILSRLDSVEISKLLIFGNSGVSAETVEASAISAVQNGKFQIWNKNSTFFYPTGFVEKKILDDIKSFSSVKVKRSALNTVSIEVVERKPAGLWCEGDYGEKIEKDYGGCYFFDEEGFIFTKAPIFSDGVYVRFWGGFLSGGDPVGSYFTESEIFNGARFFISTLESENISVSDFIFDSNGDYVISAESGSRILISPRVGMSRSLDNLRAFLGGAGEENGPALIGEFEYIDLRFDNKIYYRFRGD